MITLVNYGTGNLGAVLNMLHYIGAPAQVAAGIKEIESAEKLLIPGVGAFDPAMQRINATPGLRDALDKHAARGTPILGICLGMQLFTDSSDEGNLPGFGWIRGRAYRLPQDHAGVLKVPHMGWNTAQPTPAASDHPLWKNLPADARFYFVHSYGVQAVDREAVLATAYHGVTFDAVLAQSNLFAAQFHPERSHRFGMMLLKNFAAL